MKEAIKSCSNCGNVFDEDYAPSRKSSPENSYTEKEFQCPVCKKWGREN